HSAARPFSYTALFRSVLRPAPCARRPGVRIRRPMSENTPPEVPVPDYRPVERFWPYVDLPEQPTPEELASLHPELAEALFGRPKLPFSMSLEFSPFDEPGYSRALELARASAEYREIRTPNGIRHRARFYPEAALKLRDLFE